MCNVHACLLTAVPCVRVETPQKPTTTMGAYLSQPNTTKTSSDGGNGSVSYGFSAMQGWRVSMEVRGGCVVLCWWFGWLSDRSTVGTIFNVPGFCVWAWA